MTTKLLFAFVVVLFVSCGKQTNKGSGISVPQTTDTNNKCGKIDTISAKKDTAMLQDERVEILRFTTRCTIPKAILDQVRREKYLRDSIEKEVAKVYDEIKKDKTDSVNH